MSDVFSKRKRSAIMSRVRARGNKATELAMVSLLSRHKITGWRRHWPIFGRPDFVFPEHRLALFVDGCFWHACPQHGESPATNPRFWREKLARNRTRDRMVTRGLKKRGWAVLRIWQHELTIRNEERLVRRIRTALDRALVL